MTTETLSLRALNRALLARQMLLAREPGDAVATIERLVGMQAQWPGPPFVGLWTRLVDFPGESLTRAIHDRRVVRATLMRGTLHLFSARDYLAHRMALQPMLTASFRGIFRDPNNTLELATLLAAARPHFVAGSLTFAALREKLATAFPDVNEREMGYLVRMHLPLVGAPDDTEWSFHADAHFVDAATWLGAECAPETRPHELVLRYLAAFGPASVADAQSWSGLRGLKATFEELRPRLVAFRDARNRELFDLPDAPRPPDDSPAPVRYLPAFDNLTLSHDDRTRVISDAHRRLIATKNGLIAPMFLVDGFVAGKWKSTRRKDVSTISLAPFVKLTKTAKRDLTAEGERLSRFLSPDATKHEVEFEAG